MSRPEHDALLTAIRAMTKALDASGIKGPKTDQMRQTMAELKLRLHANVPTKELTIATQSDI